MLILVALLALPFYARRPGIVLLCNIFLQAVVLGGSQEVSFDKVWYAFYFVVSMAVLTPAAIRHWRESVRVPLVKWLLALFALFAVSRIVGAAHGLTVSDWFRDVSPLLNYVFILYGISVFRTVRDIRRFLIRTNILLLLVAIPTVMRWMWYRDVVSEPSPLMNIANASPSIFLFGFFIALLLAIDTRNRRETAIHLGMCTVFLLFMLLCGMRSEVVSVVVGSFVVLTRSIQTGVLRARPVLKVAMTLLMTAFVSAVIALTSGSLKSDALTERFSSAVRSDVVEDQSFTNRIVEMNDSLDAFVESPILGRGLGFQTNSLIVVGTVTYANDQYFIHIMPAYVAAKFGLIGIILVTGFYVQTIRTAMAVSSKGNDSLNISFGASFAGLTVCLLLVSMLSNLFVDRTSTGLFGLLAGLLVYFEAQRVPARSKR